MEYLIETKHTGGTCLKALDEIADYKPAILEKVAFGCSSGVHVGWAEVEAGSKEEALELIPTTLRGDTRVVEVGKFSEEQIRSMHK